MGGKGKRTTLDKNPGKQVVTTSSKKRPKKEGGVQEEESSQVGHELHPLWDDGMHDINDFSTQGESIDEASGSQQPLIPIIESQSTNDATFTTTTVGGSEDVGRSSNSNKFRHWCISSQQGGGPHIPSLIPSFGGHVASYLWDQSIERGVIVCNNREVDCLLLSDWLKNMKQEPFALVMGKESSRSIGGIVHGMFPHIDWPLISAFVERWQPDTNSFHMPFGEMTITLHDVFYILRLPIDGSMVEGARLPPKISALDVAAEYVESTPDDMKANGTYKNGGVIVKTLIDKCKSKDRSKDVEASAYLLAVLGSTLFVEKSKNRVIMPWIPYAYDLEKFHDYSWGSATLAYLYRQLGIASRVGCKQIGGCLSLLQAWIYSYFPMFRPTRYRNTITPGDPTIRSWPHTQESRSDDRLVMFRAMLDKLTPIAVEWTPFGQEPYLDVLRTIMIGFIRCLDILEPYMPDRALRQFGVIQQIPRDPFKPSEANRPSSSNKYAVKHSPEMASSLWTYDSSRVQLDSLTRAPVPWEVSHDYEHWYTQHSHPHIIPPTDGVNIGSTVDMTVDIDRHFQNLFTAALPLYGLQVESFDLTVRPSIQAIHRALSDFMFATGYHPPQNR